MTDCSEYPRVLVVAMGRINAKDSANNGLLLRNLLGDWPQANTAQIFSGNDNGDNGFFGQYYRLSTGDRRFGRLYARLRVESRLAMESHQDSTGVATPFGLRARRFGMRYFVESGIYELVFPIRVSQAMCGFVNSFRPQVVFVQGYSLSFVRLALDLSARIGAPIAYFPTDDWSLNRYSPRTSPCVALSWLPRCCVLSATGRLVNRASVRLAFNPYMRQVFRARYGHEFDVLMHGDEPARFARVAPRRDMPFAAPLIVCAGDFDAYRWELLEDMEHACRLLVSSGLNAQVIAYPVHVSSWHRERAKDFQHVALKTCPAHDELVAVLRGADILFLPERFGPEVWMIASSVSSKAHLFMFSGVPTIVYADGDTGVARYAREAGWAEVVDRRDPALLAAAVRELAGNAARRAELTVNARRTLAANHNLPVIQERFREMLSAAAETSQGEA